MSLFRTAAIVISILLSSILMGIPSARTEGENAPSKPAGDAAIVPIILPSATPPGDVDVKKKNGTVKRKKNRKKMAKKTDEATAEMSSSQKLTVKQVNDILKSSKDFSGKNLSGLQLVGSNLSKCNLKGVDLSQANLERADLGGSDLERANLTGANLKMASFWLSSMKGVNLERAILDGAVWKDGSICRAGSVGQCLESIPTPFGK